MACFSTLTTDTAEKNRTFMTYTFLVLVTALLFYYIGRFSVLSEDDRKIRAVIKQKIADVVAPRASVGVIKRPTAEDLQRRSPEHKALLKEWRPLLNKMGLGKK